MKFSELWLREWVNPAIDSEALFEQITMAGLEVDFVEPVVAMGVHGIVVGEVVECSEHPHTDKLHVTKVNIGSERLLDILCEAPNCRQGLKVAVATLGAVLAGDFKIKAATLDDELSEGMLCSFSELGISNEHNSEIIELPLDAPIGANIRDYLKLDDNIVEISVTPNRADCLSIIGVAREIAVLNQQLLTMPAIAPVTSSIGDTVPIQVNATDACPRYLGRVVKGINAKVPTPLWITEKLRRCGILSIDVVIDVTNYVLMELGQPMHVFDLDHINGGIIVRMAKEDETLLLHDSSEVKLKADTMVIADYKKALAIGGIFGGQYSSVNDKTQNVLLECAFFSPLLIAGRARHYGLHTNVSQRYERGVDPALQYRAMEHATRLLINICGGEAGPVIDVTNEAMLPKRAIITLRRSKLARVIGHIIADKQVTDILRWLGCKVTEGKDEWQVVAPSWRFDMEIEEDLIEEVARVYGYHNIPNEPIKANLTMGNHREANLSLKRIKTMLNDKGYQEVITYSFVDPKVQQLIHPAKEALMLLSPISSQMSVMRLSLWTGLLSIVLYNQHRQQSCLRIFEAGLCFIPDTQAPLQIRQDLMLGGVICGNRYEEHWNLTKESLDFYDLKGDLESVLDLTGKLDDVKFIPKANPALHPGQSAAIYLKGECIGFIGVLHPKLECQLDLNGRTMLFQLHLDAITERIVPQAKNISRFPVNRRDIAVVVPEYVPAADILLECKKVGVNQIGGVNLFDVYRGKGIANGYKSLAMSLIFQDTSRTLEEEEIAAIVNTCVEALKERFQASLRDGTYGAYKS